MPLKIQLCVYACTSQVDGGLNKDIKSATVAQSTLPFNTYGKAKLRFWQASLTTSIYNLGASETTV